MSAHTPAPWLRGEEHESKIEVDAGQPRHCICVVRGGMLSPDMEANFRLIVAGPEMLEALRDQVQKCWARSGVGLPDHEADCEKCRPARAAIAKATGSDKP